MNSPVAKRSVFLAGTRTSISLEEEFWVGLREIAARRGVSLSEVLGEIDRERERSNLSSATRVYVLRFFRTTPTDVQTQATAGRLARRGGMRYR
jgi:predicted DNA-binding ribbon-helix-helix protein